MHRRSQAQSTTTLRRPSPAQHPSTSHCSKRPAGRPRARRPVASLPPVPDRSTWHAEPVKVFDNLYYVGEKEFSAWAVVTSDGIIVIDTIWAYSVEDEIVGGLKKLSF